MAANFSGESFNQLGWHFHPFRFARNLCQWSEDYKLTSSERFGMSRTFCKHFRNAKRLKFALITSPGPLE